jgi:hypothetical protein
MIRYGLTFLKDIYIIIFKAHILLVYLLYYQFVNTYKNLRIKKKKIYIYIEDPNLLLNFEVF